MFETIVALATPPLKSALAIVRLSGDNCFFVVNNFFSKDLTKYTKNNIIHSQIIDNNELVDDVVLLLYKEPNSFTGENSVEIISHGSPLIFNKIIELSIKYGARMATRGEYTSRAFMHNKLDLIQAESINDLINAESEESKKLSLMSLTGKTSSLIEPLKKDFIDLLSNIEVNIDYPEYKDIEEVNNAKIEKTVDKSIDYISKLISDGKKANIIKDGINVAIVGKPNVGKSSILNALIGEDKAIVTNIKGTTRDIVEGKFIYKGIVINLFDTAGIRESDDIIESIKVYNKSHLIDEKDSDFLYISALNGDINILKDAIISKLNLDQSNYTTPSINNARELGILENIKGQLLEIKSDINLPIDLLASRLKEVLNLILSITGEDYDFDMISEIFSRFCVGK